MIAGMSLTHHQTSQAALMALETAAAAARGGFACVFSTSDEYESALITERRAQGRYAPPRRTWPVAVFVGLTLIVAAVWMF